MTYFKLMAVALATTTALGSAALAADQTAANKTASNQSTNQPGNQTANHDFTKLSKAGMQAFEDVRLARLAIFDGDTALAKTDIDQAESAMAKARTDNTAFLKAEADLTPPKEQSAKTTAGANTAASTTPINWLPVDGSVTLDEDFTASAGKSAGVAKANQQLKQGNTKEAMQQLKLADVNALFVAELAPLDASTSGIQKAAQLIDQGQYFEANQALKHVEDAVRFDAVDVDGMPRKAAQADTSKATTDSTKVAASTPSATPATH